MRTPRTPSIQREGCARWPERMCASPSRGAGAREASRMVAREGERGARTGFERTVMRADARHRPAARSWGAEPKHKASGRLRNAHGRG